MIRVVLDTNIFVGALIRSGGLASRIYQAAIAHLFEPVTSPQILQEIGEVLFRPEVKLKHRKSEARVQQFLQEIEKASTKVAGDLNLKVISADPDDDKFIIAAVQGEAQYIVSRDSHLLNCEESPALWAGMNSPVATTRYLVINSLHGTQKNQPCNL